MRRPSSQTKYSSWTRSSTPNSFACRFVPTPNGRGDNQVISSPRHQSRVPSRVSSAHTVEAGSAISKASTKRVGAEARKDSSTAGSTADSLSRRERYSADGFRFLCFDRWSSSEAIVSQDCAAAWVCVELERLGLALLVVPRFESHDFGLDA